MSYLIFYFAGIVLNYLTFAPAVKLLTGYSISYRLLVSILFVSLMFGFAQSEKTRFIQLILALLNISFIVIVVLNYLFDKFIR